MTDVVKSREHFEIHQKYPATKKEILETCYKLSDISAEDRAFVEKTLPERTFLSAKEVEGFLGL